MPTQTYNWGLTDMPITLEQNATLKHINIRKEGPADDTALRAALKAERERCLAECEKIHARGFRETAFECIEAIRALEDN